MWKWSCVTLERRHVGAHRTALILFYLTQQQQQHLHVSQLTVWHKHQRPPARWNLKMWYFSVCDSICVLGDLTLLNVFFMWENMDAFLDSPLAACDRRGAIFSPADSPGAICSSEDWNTLKIKKLFHLILRILRKDQGQALCFPLVTWSRKPTEKKPRMSKDNTSSNLPQQTKTAAGLFFVFFNKIKRFFLINLKTGQWRHDLDKTRPDGSSLSSKSKGDGGRAATRF